MGVVIKVSKNNTKEQTLKALDKLAKKNKAGKSKSLENFYGKMPGVFGDGLTYQKQMRNE